MLLVLFIVVVALLIALSAFTPIAPSLSQFELGRQKKNGQADKLELRREQLFGDIVSLQRVLSSLLLVVAVALSIAQFGWILGIVIAIVIALEYMAIARLPSIRRTAQKFYQKYELHILELSAKYQSFVWWLRAVIPETQPAVITSKAELDHLIQTAGSTLTDDEKKLLQHSLSFDTRRVSDSMTPRSVVDTVKKSEILGPLVLDSLHKTGHNRFPVIDGDIDHVVGTLYLRDVLTLDTRRKHTATAETAMDKRVYYIHEHQSLTHALTAFLKTHHHLFVVVNEFRETVGILTLEDTMEALLGRPIIDEFDAHDDLRSVAARNPKGNHTSSYAKDV